MKIHCLAAWLFISIFGQLSAAETPNIILCMSDDQGWGDVAYMGHPVLKTPHLDAMAASGIRFDRWYSASAVCSPTRAACLTGRHPMRIGIHNANSGYLRREEITIAEILKARGYTSGHFGKWHLGVFTRKIKDSNRGGPRAKEELLTTPLESGFDVCFSTEAKVPTWNPMGTDTFYGTRYWTGPEQVVPVDSDSLKGDDSRVIMDQALGFIRKAAKSSRPFFTVIWFHTPHLPTVAGPKYLEMYKGEKDAHYFGCITAMDEQMGRLRAELDELGVAKNTMLWFCSDNGPEGKVGAPGKTPFRGRKRSLHEGGIRVPGLLVWPAKIRKPRVVDMPCVVSDYLPTICDVVNYELLESEKRPLDGISLLPLIEGRMKERTKAIAFDFKGQLALIGQRYKIYSKRGPSRTFELFDLTTDPREEHDLAAQKPGLLSQMSKELLAWVASCTKSRNGADYHRED